MSPHTPGPWHVVEAYDGSRTIAICRDFRQVKIGLHVTADHDWVGGADESRLFANARLIAAAPDLLTALRNVLAQFDTGVFVRNTESDGCSDWAIKAAKPLAVLAAAKAAIANAAGDP